MIVPDVNTLIYAFNKDHPGHSTYVGWLASVVNGREGLALVDASLTGFIRVITNARIWDQPAPTGAAMDFVNTLIDASSSRWLPANRAVWTTLAGLVRDDRGVRANLVPDAYLAAICIAHGARLATSDRGFARFPRLTWFDPAEQP